MKIVTIEDNLYPKRLKEIIKPPEKLYIEGDISNLNNIGIAVVGSRNCTQYGVKMCKIFTEKLVEYNINIISGMAVGIDTVAHKTALQNLGKTIAVLPSGFNKIYPEENKELFNNIIDSGGAVISQYMLDTEADTKKFVERNRLVCGLAVGTLVIEGGYRSGTRITARFTKSQNKPVFCIPNSIENKNSYTNNMLIKQGAFLVTDERDIFNQLNGINFIKRKLNEENIEKRETKCNNKQIKISDEYKKIYDAILGEPIFIDEIHSKVSMPIGEINSKLMMMEIEGYIKELPGRRFIRNE